MKKQFLPSVLALCLILCVEPMAALAAEDTTTDSTTSDGITLESEHPPLSEATKEAIAAYKKNPTEDTKQAVLDALNEAYDAVVQNKENNLEKYTQARTQKIGGWMKTVLNGGTPAFMSLTTDSKETERDAVTNAIEAYQENSSSANRSLVKQALEAYYDAFLQEQQDHLTETEDLRDSRIAASLAYFTSDLFSPEVDTENTVEEEDALAEIICAYISVGAEIVPVNPDARVREREINAAISSAQMAYLDDPTEENLENLQNEVAQAYQTAYDVRVDAFATAEAKGDDGASTLFTQMLDSDFRSTQFENLTEQLNLYGRIDRIVTYGSNTYGDNWTPRMETESHELAELLTQYEASPTTENEQAVETKFYEIYDSMLSLQKTHLEETQAELSTYTENTVNELIND